MDKKHTKQAVILCGGQGTRLLPYTTVFPKPLVPLGDRPILEILLRKLAKEGITDCRLAVGHLAELIEAFCGDGSRFGVKLTYYREDEPLGTAGPLTQIDDLDDSFLVMNGDLLTNLKIQKLLDYHQEKKACATIATHKREIKIDLGVLDTNPENFLVSYTEKPVLPYEVSMGIYVFNKEIVDLIPEKTRFDFPDLVKKLLDNQTPVAAYPFEGYWLDIGRPEDYSQAQNDISENPSKFLGDES